MAPGEVKSVSRRDESAEDGSFLARVRRGFGEIFGTKAPEPPPQRKLQWKRAAGAAVSSEDSEFLGQIRTLLSSAPELHASRVNVIGLARVKERLGAQWARVAERADRIARNVIERHLAPGDIYSKWGEETYVTVFVRLTENEARVKSFLIGNEIVRTLLGDEGSELIEVRSAVTRIDGNVDLTRVEGLDIAFEAGEIVDHTSRSAQMPVEAPPDPPKIVTPEPNFAPVHQTKPRTQARHRANVLAGVDFLFHPMWDPVRSVIATYSCAPRVRLSDLDGATGDAQLAVAGDPEAMAKLDHAVLACIKAELTTMERENRRFILVMPINFETLASASQRRRLAQELATLPEKMRQYLVVELVAVPAGVLKSRLTELTAPLKPNCRAVGLQLAMDTIDMSQLRGSGVIGVGCNVENVMKPEFIQMQQLGRFQKTAEKAGVITFLHGVSTRSLVAAAIGAGFHFIGGEAVADAAPHPKGVVKLELADLYRRP